MSTPIIQCEGIGKRYRLGQTGSMNRTFGEMLYDRVGSLFRKNAEPTANTQNNRYVWALDDINFNVQPGEVVGIIGRNGAGKSTLLKVLSRITDPTKGRITLRGRVASLLEVGTGFHPELTGRENIFLNGSILGMRRAEIRSKLDEIIAFSGVEKFLDTPVKRYSSGMSVRLAFSVAAHLEPEILVIDEVLAVGDATFQKRCLGKLDEVANSGRTVLFVSHNMAAVQRLCTRGILIDHGQVVADGNTEQVVEAYLNNANDPDQATQIANRKRREGLGTQLRIINCKINNQTEQQTDALRFGENMSIEIEVEAKTEVRHISIIAGIESPLRGRLMTSLSEEACGTFSLNRGERRTLRLQLDDSRLLPGQYTVTVGARSIKGGLDQVEHAVGFKITDALADASCSPNDRAGVIYLPAQWKINPSSPIPAAA